MKTQLSWGIKMTDYIWSAEIINRPPADFPFKAALFDFDGTISLIREGWQQIMVPYFTEVLLNTPESGNRDSTERLVNDFVDELTGKQTIFQCIRLCDEIRARGGVPEEPFFYKNEYLQRLLERIDHRLKGLKNGSLEPRSFCVKGAYEFIEILKARGIELILASGTDEEAVLEEALLLDVSKFFNGHIYGAHADLTDCSKEFVINEILKTKGLSGNQLLVFGDGFVEIEVVKNKGGYAVAVATDERTQRGVDTRKRERLLTAGADMVIPNFENAGELINILSNYR